MLRHLDSISVFKITAGQGAESAEFKLIFTLREIEERNFSKPLKIEP